MSEQLLTVNRGGVAQETIKFVMETCCNCGIPFLMPLYLQNRAINDTSIYFYCPNGHGQHYTGKSEAKKLQEQLDAERKRHAELMEAKTNLLLDTMNERNELQRKLKRVNKGVCPCCNRSFSNLERHMKSKHPEKK